MLWYGMGAYYRWVLSTDGCPVNQEQPIPGVIATHDIFFSLGTYFKSPQFNWIMRQSVLLKQKQLGNVSKEKTVLTSHGWNSSFHLCTMQIDGIFLDWLFSKQCAVVWNGTAWLGFQKGVKKSKF